MMKRDTVPYNTNLAAEFWVLSTLYRFGVEAYLTLGNKKSVDILILHNSKITSSIDVKGLADRYDWPADNISVFNNPNHFYVFLTFNGTISKMETTPSVWIVPSTEVNQFIKQYKTRKVVARKLITNNGNDYKDAWYYFTEK
jgi:hypothetical protein